jgi:hypothetical protein
MGDRFNFQSSATTSGSTFSGGQGSVIPPLFDEAESVPSVVDLVAVPAGYSPTPHTSAVQTPLGEMVFLRIDLSPTGESPPNIVSENVYGFDVHSAYPLHPGTVMYPIVHVGHGPYPVAHAGLGGLSTAHESYGPFSVTHAGHGGYRARVSSRHNLVQAGHGYFIDAELGLRSTNIRTLASPYVATAPTAFSNVEALRVHGNPNVLPRLIRYLTTFFRPAYGQALANRIVALSVMVREEEGTELSSDSLASLIAFLETNPAITKRPSLSVGPHGEFLASWYRREGQELTARFLRNGSIQFVSKVPNERSPNGCDRISGETTFNRLFELASVTRMPWVLGRE